MITPILVTNSFRGGLAESLNAPMSYLLIATMFVLLLLLIVILIQMIKDLF